MYGTIRGYATHLSDPSDYRVAGGVTPTALKPKARPLNPKPHHGSWIPNTQPSNFLGSYSLVGTGKFNLLFCGLLGE